MKRIKKWMPVAVVMRASLTLLLFMVSPSWAFVGQLVPAHPPSGGGIPCLLLGAMLRNYVKPGGPSAAQLGNILQREFVPGGWTAQDTTDNTNLIALIDGAADKQVLITEIQDFCVAWENDIDEINTPEKFRTRIGIPNP